MKTLNLKYYFCLIGLALVLNACKTPTYIYENSGHRIDMKKSKNLYKNYNDNLKPAVETQQKNNVSRAQYAGTEYVLISIQQLENYLKFLKEVERTNKAKSNPDKEITGIAIFLGAHSNSMTLDSLPKFNHKIRSYDKMNETNDRLVGDIRGRITMFLAPTFRDSNNLYNNGQAYNNEFERHIPFFIMPDNLNNIYKGNYENLLHYLNPNAYNISIRGGGDGTSLNADEMNSMPPKQ